MQRRLPANSASEPLLSCQRGIRMHVSLAASQGNAQIILRGGNGAAGIVAPVRMLIVAALCGTLAGCASAADSGPMPLGPDTYRMHVRRAPILGGGMEAQKV